MSKAAYNVYAAGGAVTPTYIEDVFSTYLYTGNGSGLEINNGIALGNSLYGPSVALNGTTDYLSKSSDLTGAADGKTFTFSAWVYITGTGSDYRIYHSNDTGSGWPRFAVFVNCSSTSSATVTFVSYPTDGTKRLDVRSPVGAFGRNGWNHILASFDMASQANSKMYINDVSVTLTVDTFVDIALSFSNNEHYVGAESSSAGKLAGRISNVYLDYTYRDLTVEANRRLFRTSTGQPATGQASLSPILYMPFDGTTAIGVNSGTGGNFTVNGSPTALTENGPYLATGVGKGGLVWIKSRTSVDAGTVFDTARGATNYLFTSTTAAQATFANTLTAFNSNGFSLGTDTNIGTVNNTPNTYASWTFRKQRKFFDVVTYTGTGTTNIVNHNLGSMFGSIIIKKTNSTGDWLTLNRKSNGNYVGLYLNSTAAAFYDGSITSPGPSYMDSSTFNPNWINSNVASGFNDSGATYVAYLFAHDAGGFGLTGNDNVISCGSYTPADGGAVTVTLGYEPQWILIKRTNSGDNWYLMDNMRGMGVSSSSVSPLNPNLSAAESTSSFNSPNPTATGFIVNGNTLSGGTTANSYIYIAIRRGPMKVPTLGTSVFVPVLYTGDSTTDLSKKVTAGFPVDLSINFNRNGVGAPSRQFFDRLRQRFGLQPSSSSTESDGGATQIKFDSNSQVSIAYDNINYPNNYVDYLFRRAPGFFDEVCYTGNYAGNPQIPHNLTVAPELIIAKCRSNAGAWYINSPLIGTNFQLAFNTSAKSSGSTYTLTSTYFQNPDINYPTGDTFVAYLFATCPGVSKVGSYTGNGSTQTIDCGFAAGARFVLIKRTDSSGDWYIFDTARGIIAGNDPFSFLNGTAAETTSYDAVDPANSGFIVNNDVTNFPINVSSATYIFLAIA